MSGSKRKFNEVDVLALGSKSQVKKLTINYFQWEIENFDTYSASKVCSPFFHHKFWIPEDELHFKLFSNAKVFFPNETSKNYTIIGLSLIRAGAATFNKKFPLSVKYRLSIVDANGDKRHNREMIAEFMNYDSVDSQYNLNYNYLTNPANGLLVNGKLTIYCEVYRLDTKLYSNLPRDFGLLLENGNLSDVTFIVGDKDKDLKAHKAVLAARSPVFNAMFGHKDTKESLENRVEIHDIAFEVLEQMIRFIYTDEVNFDDEIAEELLIAADRYQIDSLKSICEDYLAASLTIESLARVGRIVLPLLPTCTTLSRLRLNASTILMRTPRRLLKPMDGRI